MTTVGGALISQCPAAASQPSAAATGINCRAEDNNADESRILGTLE